MKKKENYAICGKNGKVTSLNHHLSRILRNSDELRKFAENQNKITLYAD
jgi:hypothetical protein